MRNLHIHDLYSWMHMGRSEFLLTVGSVCGLPSHLVTASTEGYWWGVMVAISVGRNYRTCTFQLSVLTTHKKLLFTGSSASYEGCPWGFGCLELAGGSQCFHPQTRCDQLDGLAMACLVIWDIGMVEIISQHCRCYWTWSSIQPNLRGFLVLTCIISKPEINTCKIDDDITIFAEDYCFGVGIAVKAWEGNFMTN